MRVINFLTKVILFLTIVEKTVAQIKFNSAENKNQKQHNDPFEILPADLSEYFTDKFPKKQENTLYEHTRYLSDSDKPYTVNDKHQKILISTEPVPKRSETLLVLLGVYLAFFALAAFFLFCLILAWLERRSRRHRNILTSEIKQRKSLFLYMNPKKGTVKYIA
ncbi:hypothetical protein Mgra_00003943 [Meloidogyne graminicola]|uniref:Uncharacterized protein n=1 Tax=Meloidogyne graminicola TaxID=189291 RepID=A0A8S9ZSV9_9BILA|nr:hypothetical protein Mgra_00003943 [Meloidogyne graminicola]